MSRVDDRERETIERHVQIFMRLHKVAGLPSERVQGLVERLLTRVGANNLKFNLSSNSSSANQNRINDAWHKHSYSARFRPCTLRPSRSRRGLRATHLDTVNAADAHMADDDEASEGQPGAKRIRTDSDGESSLSCVIDGQRGVFDTVGRGLEQRPPRSSWFGALGRPYAIAASVRRLSRAQAAVQLNFTGHRPMRAVYSTRTTMHQERGEDARAATRGESRALRARHASAASIAMGLSGGHESVYGAAGCYGGSCAYPAMPR